MDQTRLDPTAPKVLQGSNLHCVVKQEEVLKDLDLLKTNSAALLVLLEKAEGEDVTVGQQSQIQALKCKNVFPLQFFDIRLYKYIRKTTQYKQNKF